jgi:hypothetical protein
MLVWGLISRRQWLRAGADLLAADGLGTWAGTYANLRPI